MSKLIQGTSVPNKNLGDKLFHTDINSINGVVNTTAGVVNNSLREFCNINLEEFGDMTRKMTLQEAAGSVVIPRRTLGMRIKYLSSETLNWETYDYVGISVSNEDWINVTNWNPSDNVLVVDGGEF